MKTAMKMISLLLPLIMVSFASADYHIGFVVRSIEFLSPNNTLADGSCCDSSCGTDGDQCCDNGCSPSMRLCFREPQHPTDDASCPLLEVVRNTAQTLVVFSTNNSPIQGNYTGGFQVYIMISHKIGNDADFDPPFDDPLIEEIFLEFIIPAASFSDRLDAPAQLIVTNGMFNRVEITVAAVVHCADGWNGSVCECPANGCISATGPLAPSSPEGVLSDENGSNSVGIAVGVLVGVVVLVLVVVIVIKKKTTWTGSFKPNRIVGLSYTLKSKCNIRAMRPDYKQPLTGNDDDDHLYATIDKTLKRKKRVKDDDDDVPPPVPPFRGEHTEERAHQDVVYQNLSVVNHEVD